MGPTSTSSAAPAPLPAEPLAITLESYTDKNPPYDSKDDADATIQRLVDAHETRPMTWSIEGCATEAHPHRGDEILSHLAASKLDVVDISITRCGVTNAGVEALMSSPIAAKLVSLNLAYGFVGHLGAQAIAKAPRAKLETLVLGRNSIGAVGAAALATGGPFPALRTLDLGGTSLGDEGAEAIAGSSAFPALTFLATDEDFLGDRSAKAIARMTQKLTRIDLAGNEIGDDGALALFHADALAQVKISLDGNVIGAAADVLKTRQIHSESGPGGGFSLDDQSKPSLALLPKPIKPPRAADAALPETVVFRHMHFFGQETGFDYPIFMHAGAPYGNGGGRDFYWEDKAHLVVGAFANTQSAKGTENHETRAPDRVTMKRTVNGASWVIVAEFSFDPADEAYYRAVANAVFASLRYEK